jgi:predicted MPP superfamily phosphohydrolase
MLSFYFWVVILCILIALVAMIIFWLCQDNNRLTVSHYTFGSSKIKRQVRILQLSDLHNKQFGKQNIRLTKIIMMQRPDLIVFTGDLEDRRESYKKSSTLFLAGLAEKVPVYFVYGNQEMKSDFKERLAVDLINGGVTVLEGQTAIVNAQGQTLSILGLNDYEVDVKHGSSLNCNHELLSQFQQTSDFKLLLTHYPHHFYYYKKDYQYSNYNLDLILAGHAHGGLIRFPFLKGVIAPGQGLFPRYTSGMYQQNGVSMIVSRGLGNSGFPFRIFNPPDVVVVTLLP